jgi:hypothetical protein
MKVSLNNEPQLICPKCKTTIKLTESLAAPLIAKTRKQFEQQLADKQADFAKREGALRKAQTTLKRAREAINEEVAIKLEVERGSIALAEAKKAKLAISADLKQRDRRLADLQKSLQANNAKLAEAQQAQALVMRKSRELDDAKREIDLTVEKQVQAALENVRSEAKAEVEDDLRAKVSEKEAQIIGMQRQIEVLSRKADQGSQQLQGEALEIELERSLRERFPRDIMKPVPNGEFGGDLLHSVINQAGQKCGLILWEAKRTKNWSERWLPKLRHDQRAANAGAALIVTTAVPKGVDTFNLVEGVWITKPRYAIPLAIALRKSIIESAESNFAAEDQRTKTELVYQYLTGPRFRSRIDAIVEKFTDMQIDLDRERKAMTRLWAKREEQLKGVLNSSAGLYGDLQGIAGQAVPELERLSLLNEG